jgi:hypothetical protein
MVTGHRHAAEAIWVPRTSVLLAPIRYPVAVVKGFTHEVSV